ncbi:hypothetical protein GCM10009797_38960 [Nocardioides hwasunensis]
MAGGSWLLAALLLTGISAAAAGAPPAELAGAPSIGDAAWVVGLVLVTLQALALAGADRRVHAALVVVAAAAPIGGLVGLGPAIGCTSVAVIVAAFRASADAFVARTWVALSGAAVLVACGELVVQVRADAPVAQALGASLLQGVGTIGLPALVGLVVATRRDSTAARADRLRAEAGERAALVEAAVARERTAMARELHDIAAHHLTGIAVMSAAIGKQIDRDPEAAKLAVAQVREQSTSMLRDMRGLVGLLRPDPTDRGDDDERVPQESFDGIAGLVDAAALRGEPAELVVRAPEGPDPREQVGPLVQLSAYRTVQEALTNAARHAPGQPCRVEVDARSVREVRVTVSNRMPVPGRSVTTRGGGFGLVGMRERAELTDCRLTCEEVDGAWLVTLLIPVRQDPLLASPDDGGARAEREAR